MILLVLAAALIAALVIEPFCVRLRRDVLPGPASLAGLKIAFVSDLHCQGEPSLFRIGSALSRLEREKPHLLILGGDYADAPDWAKKALALASAFDAPLGVFAVRGNHDYYYHLNKVLSDLPIRLLDNEGALVQYGEGTLLLAGLADYVRDTPNAESALKNSDQAHMTVLICHNPRAVREGAGQHADFALCGHTHGGQVTIFGLYSPLADRPLPAYKPQWLNHGGVPTLYSNGLGTTFLPIRFLAPPQIHIIETKAGESG
ncbi:MAG: metallophosphoesterase [Christensenellales bacterium]|jgi:predicted MPP superfamily phosphohydrolase